MAHLIAWLTLLQLAAAQNTATLASQYGLATSTSLSFPSATLSTSDAQDFLLENWGLSRGRIQTGGDNLAFVSDPFPVATPTPQTPSASPVLEVTYPAGSYSHDTGGAQFFATWNASGDAFQSAMLSYDVAFDAGFDWVKGGKLPGLRGGPNATGCSGGNQPNGSECFSARVMWRANAAGEGTRSIFQAMCTFVESYGWPVYAYIPTPNDLCKQSGIDCNDDYGTSIQRGSFGFLAGR